MIVKCLSAPSLSMVVQSLSSVNLELASLPSAALIPTRMQPLESFSAVLPEWISIPSKLGTANNRGNLRRKCHEKEYSALYLPAGIHVLPGTLFAGLDKSLHAGSNVAANHDSPPSSVRRMYISPSVYVSVYLERKISRVMSCVLVCFECSFCRIAAA